MICKALGFTRGERHAGRQRAGKQAMWIGQCPSTGSVKSCQSFGNFCYHNCNYCAKGQSVGVQVRCYGSKGAPRTNSCQTCGPTTLGLMGSLDIMRGAGWSIGFDNADMSNANVA